MGENLISTRRPLINKSASSFCSLLFIHLFSTSTGSPPPQTTAVALPQGYTIDSCYDVLAGRLQPFVPSGTQAEPRGWSLALPSSLPPTPRPSWTPMGAQGLSHLLCHPCPRHPSSCWVHPSGRLMTPVPSDLRPSASRAQLCRGTWPSIFLHVKPRLSASSLISCPEAPAC